MKDDLIELKDRYREVREFQYEVRKRYIEKEIKFNDDHYNKTYSKSKIGSIDVAENCIEILYMELEGGEEIECVEYMSFEEFIKYVDHVY